MRVTHFLPEDSQKMWNGLETLISHKFPSWFPHLRCSNLPEIAGNLMLGPDVLYDKIRPIKYPFTVFFADVVKAETKLGYLAWNEELSKRELINKLMSSAKSVRILHVCKQIVLAQLELDFNGDNLENFRVDAGTAVALIWTPAGAEELIKSKRFTIDNWVSLEDARFLVVLNSGYGKLWKTNNPPMATPIASAHKAQSLPLDSLFVTGDEEDIRQQISAVHNLCDSHTPGFSR